MPNQGRSISTTVKGMVWDFHPMYMQDGMYAYAQNAVIESFDGMGMPIIQNEPSNVLAVSFPTGSTVVSQINIVEQNRIVWFISYPETGMSEIGESLNLGNCRKPVTDGSTYCDNCGTPNLSELPPLETIKQIPCATYTTIQADSCLDFSDTAPINNVVYRITDCSLQIFWAQPGQPRKWIEFNYVNDDPTQGLVISPFFYEIIGEEPPPCSNPIYGPNLDCNALNVQPNIETPCIEFIEEVAGGSLIAGGYQFFIAMSDASGNKLSSFFSETNLIPINTRQITLETNYPTDRAIKLEIENLDPLGVFQYYILAVAKTIDNVTSFALIGTFPVSQTTYTYTGNNKSEVALSADDIFATYPYYVSAGAVGQSNGILYWGNVNESVKPNLQRVANEIQLQWQTIAIPEAVYRQNQNAYRFRGYLRDEVYAFGIQFIYQSGEISNAYHIPGRGSVPSDLDIINNNDSFLETLCTDCSGSTAVTGTPVVINDIVAPCIPTPVTPCNPTLNPNNAFQSDSCPLIPFSATGCTTVSVSSSVQSLNIVNDGIGYIDGTYTLAASGGTGTGLQVSVKVLGGVVTTITPQRPNIGVGYTLGDVISIPSLPAGSGFTAMVNVVIPTPPMVSSGLNMTVTTVGSVQLNGAVTAASNNPVVSVKWNQISGPNTAFIANPTSPTTSWAGINTGTFTFQLCATSQAGDVVSAQVTFNCNVPPATAPVADAGGDQAITAPDNIVTLNGTNSTDPTGIAVYAWSQLSGPTMAVISDPTIANPTASGLTSGTYQFQLEVTNNRDCSSISTTLVYVCPDPCTAPPTCATLVSPVNGGRLNTNTSATLQWQAQDCALSYDVYVSAGAPSGFTLVGNASGTTWSLPSLTQNTAYYWYVVPKNSFGDATGCASCYFAFATAMGGTGTVCNKYRWQVYNTATLEGGDLAIYNGCEESCYQYGNMSYWESTETYPLQVDPRYDIWGELCGLPVRHHKFPDSIISHIHDQQNATIQPNGQTFATNNLVFPIGIKVIHSTVTSAISNAVFNDIITQEDADNIVGYRIVRGDRAGNKSIVAKGYLYDVNHYQRIDTTPKSPTPVIDEQPVYFSNYPYNDLRNNTFLTNDFRTYQLNNISVGTLPFNATNRYTFHSPDTHFNQPIPGTELKLETAEYGQAQGLFEYADFQAPQKLLSEFAYGISLTLAIGLVLSDPKYVPQKQSTYTVNTGTQESTSVGTGIDVEGDFAGEVEGAIYTLPATTNDDTTEFIPDVVLNYDQTLGSLIPAKTVGSSYTVTSTRGGLFQTFSPIAETNVPGSLSVLSLLQAATSGFIGFADAWIFFLNQILVEMNLLLDLIKTLVPWHKWCIQYNSIGKYNSYATVPNDSGIKRRLVNAYSYLNDTNQTISEPADPITGQSDTIFYNNNYREDALYLKYEGVPFETPDAVCGIQDNSRVQVSSAPFSCGLNKRGYTNISSFYGSVKNYVPDQYGTVYNVQYLTTDSCYFQIGTSDDVCEGVWGGDTFIPRFALKIKVPYFTATTFRLPQGTDFDFSQNTNIAFPVHYYNNTNTVGQNLQQLNFKSLVNGLTSIYELLGGPNSVRDCEGSFLNGEPIFWQDGYIYLYHYGIPYFLCESDYNADYRYGTNNKEGDFYPHQGDLHFWLQEENVPITEPNTYFYNKTYSKQNNETFIGIDPPTFQPGRECRVDHPNRIIYSDPNRWLVYRANNFYNFPQNKGEIVSITGIENQTVIVRTLNATSVFKSILRLSVDGQTSQVGNGGVFSNPPQDFGETTLGYVGSQTSAILNTEYGHVWPDAKRGQIFNMEQGGSGLDEISKYGMKNWFKENLPFRILRDFPNMPVLDADNAYLGIGITMSFDKRFNRMLLTKRDYHCINKTVTYDSTTKDFSVPAGTGTTIINLGDPKYFQDCSWTMSYNFFTKSWVSVHSYKPNYYVDFVDFFGSGINGSSSNFWTHDLYNGSFQVFYGKIYPFIVEPLIKFGEEFKQLSSVEYDVEVRRYANEFDYTIKKHNPGFNKVIIYNDWYNTGLMELVHTDKRNLSLVGKYPNKLIDKWQIEVTPANFKWRFNQFFALNRDNSEIPMFLYEGNNAEKRLNQSAFSYQKNAYTLARMKGQWFKQRFINDKYSNYKILFKLSIDNETVQYK